MSDGAQRAIGWCHKLAQFTEQPGRITRTFLSPPMSQVHDALKEWMCGIGMRAWVDAAGNLRGVLPESSSAPRLIIGSHLDTVADAGPFDGVLGVVLGLVLAESLAHRLWNVAIEVIGFSEEEGVRFGVPFIGSRAVVGSLDPSVLGMRDADGCSVRAAIQSFGLDLGRLNDAKLAPGAIGYVEFHIEQGPVLESLDLPLGIVEAIAGQSRLTFLFQGRANHAGTTPMNLRRDALAAAAEWILRVEQAGIVATVGRIESAPNVTNVIPGRVSLSLDVRHASDEVRQRTVQRLIEDAQCIAKKRGLTLSWHQQLDQSAVAMDAGLSGRLASAVQDSGYPVHRMISGAGHDGMILAPHLPSAMLFLRSPGGVSHSPEEAVLERDVEAALEAGARFLSCLDSDYPIGCDSLLSPP